MIYETPDVKYYDEDLWYMVLSREFNNFLARKRIKDIKKFIWEKKPFTQNNDL